MDKSFTTVSIKKELAQQIRKLAKLENRSITGMIKHILEYYIKGNK